MLKVIAEASKACDNIECDTDDACGEELRTELDSHANMVVVGRNATIINDTGRTVEVSPFAPDYSSLQNAPVANAAISCYCEKTG